MKKILASLMAVAMLATTALAADFTPGQKIELDELAPGWSGNAPDKELHSDNYSITEIRWEEGRSMVESVKIDNDSNKLVVTLKKDYSSTKDKTIQGTVKLREKGASKYFTIAISGTVGYQQDDIVIDADGYINNFTPSNDVLYTVKTNGNIPYGNLEFSADWAEVSVRVYEKEKYYLGYNLEPNREVLLANADTDAEMSFLTFAGTPSFNSTATVNFFDTDENSIVYEIKNGRLVKSAARWDSDSGSWLLKTKVLGSYVISNKELKSPVGTPASGSSSTGSSNSNTNNGNVSNPSTGASDVVGVVSALAVASLASVAALSIKKK